MNLKEIKKDLNPEIRKELEKSKFKVLTNENDFLVKNLKKAG
jgi:TFIIF-interacting CTD phosphatase-like protein